MSKWNPDMSAAPKGITIFGQNWRTAERGLVYCNQDGDWELVDGLTNLPVGKFFSPTHWMPLPDPPSGDT